MLILRLILLILMVATPTWAEQIHVADNDYRQFRAVRLESGLEVLLVHDERAVKSAAALALPIGSLDDPDSQPGLAHFLEHMLFLGSAAYPGAEDYQTFITANGGQTNAATGYTSTTYIIELDAGAFAEGVRRMVDTLANPLLDPVYVDKERNAVNAEMESKKHSDGLRMAMLMMSTLNPAHPGTRFTGGNLETLADKPGSRLHEELVRFHHTWYSAHLMKGVLYGPQTLDKLEALARAELTAIPRRTAEVQVPAVPPVTAAEQGIIVPVRPVRQLQSMTVEFVLPQEFDNPSTKPLHVVAAVLGAETQHSLVEFLRNRGWVLSLSVGGDQTSLRNGVTLAMHIALTDLGATHRDEVLATIFAYLEMMRREGISQEQFTQMRRMLDVEFRFAPLVSGFEYAAMAAGSMLRYPVQDVHFGMYRLDALDTEAVAAILAAMLPKRARIFHVGQDQMTDRAAFFYQTPYALRAISQQDQKRWVQLGAGLDVRMPELNPFVPDSLALVTPDSQATTTPHMIVRQPGVHVWQGQSAYRREPKSILMTRVQSPLIASTVEQSVLQGLMLEAWFQRQAGLRYQAQEAGLDVSVAADDGLVIRIDGFSQHQAELLFQTVDFLWQEVSEADFARAKTEFLKALANREKQGLFGQAISIMQSVLIAPAWSTRELSTAAERTSWPALQAYMQDIRRTAHFSVLGFGNLSAADMRDIGERLRMLSGVHATAPTKTRRIAALSGLAADYRQKSVLEDSALVELFLDPQLDPAAKARMYVLEGLISTRFYARLRTEEQLGYVATTFPVMYARGCGLGFGVQSPVRGTAGLEDRFGAFYLRALDQLRSVSTDEFESVRQGILAEQTKISDTLGEEFGWLETDFRLGNARFDGRKRFVRALRAVTLPEVLRTYERLVLGRSGTRVMIQVQGSRFAELGWAKLPNAHEIDSPSTMHALVPMQHYQGL